MSERPTNRLRDMAMEVNRLYSEQAVMYSLIAEPQITVTIDPETNAVTNSSAIVDVYNGVEKRVMGKWVSHTPPDEKDIEIGLLQALKEEPGVPYFDSKPSGIYRNALTHFRGRAIRNNPSLRDDIAIFEMHGLEPWHHPLVGGSLIEPQITQFLDWHEQNNRSVGGLVMNPTVNDRLQSEFNISTPPPHEQPPGAMMWRGVPIMVSPNTPDGSVHYFVRGQLNRSLWILSPQNSIQRSLDELFQDVNYIIGFDIDRLLMSARTNRRLADEMSVQATFQPWDTEAIAPPLWRPWNRI